MKINWKLRLQNKVTLTSIIMMGISIVYQILNAAGLTPKVEQQAIIDIFTMVIDLVALLGIVVDPTTTGVDDSYNALNYKKPKD